MRIGLDVRILGLDSPKTGIPTYVVQLASCLWSTHKEQVDLFADRPIAQWDVHVVRKLPGLPWLQTSLVAAAARSGVSLFHGPAYALPRCAPFRRVVTIHDFGFIRFPQWVDVAVRNYLRRMVPQAVEAADGIIVPTEAIRHELHELYPESRNKPVAVIPMGSIFASQHWVPTPSSPLGEIPYILHVGTLEPRKNINTLLEAFELLVRSKEIPHILVLLGAKGWNDDELWRKLQSFPFPQRIVMTGYVDLQKLASWYAHASLYVQPSWYEGFGMGTLDAFLWGIPIVASRTGWAASLSGDEYPITFVEDPGQPRQVAEAIFYGLRLKPSSNDSEANRKMFTWLDITSRHWYFYERIGGA